MALLIAEVALRIYFRNDYGVPTHRDWMFRKVWDEQYAALNTLGHRDHAFTIKKPENTFRILTIGDSLTWGEGIQDINAIYTEILEKKLNDRATGIRFEVLNVSEKGWNVQQYLDVLKEKGISYDPDLVILGFYLNDIEADKANRPKGFFLSSSLHWVLSRMSYVYWYTQSAVSGLFFDKAWIDYYLSYLDVQSPDWTRFVSLWKEIIFTCKNNRIEPIVAILPNPMMLSDAHPFLEVYRNVEMLSKAEGALVLNLFPAIRGMNPTTLRVGATDNHPSEKAHMIYADQLFHFLIKNNMLPN